MDIAWDTVLFVAAVLGAVGAVIFGRVRKVKMRRDAAWPVGKTVRVGIGDNVHLGNTLQAIQFWRDLGWPIEYTDDADYDIFIFVDPTIDPRVSIDDETMIHGMTKVWVDEALAHPTGLPIIARGLIRVVNGHNKLVIAHELGHALGIGHPRASPSGYLMGSMFQRVGWDARGLEYPDLKWRE